MKILLAEDSLGMRKIVASMLKTFGYDDLLLAEDGKQALATASALDRLDLLLTNWDMPLMDGLTLVGQLRNIPRYADLPILLFTSRHSTAAVVAASKAGIDGYLTKPFTPVQLKEKVAGILTRRAQSRVNRMARGLDPLKHEESHPLVIVGDGAASVRDLLRPDRKEVVDFWPRPSTAPLPSTRAPGKCTSAFRWRAIRPRPVSGYRDWVSASRP